MIYNVFELRVCSLETWKSEFERGWVNESEWICVDLSGWILIVSFNIFGGKENRFESEICKKFKIKN